MKKRMLTIIALVTVLVLSCMPVLAEEEFSAALPESGWVRDSAEGAVWADDRASLEVIPGEDGFKVLILWSSSAWETTEWTYICEYDPEQDILKATYVNCDNLVFDDDGTEHRTNVMAEECETVFALNEEGRLVVTDAADERLEGKAFERIVYEE